MYLLSKLSKASMLFLSALASSGGNRSQAFTIAIGFVIARQLSLPSEAVEDLSVYYRMHHAQPVLATLDSLNSTTPFDTKAARKLVEDFYAYRYRAMNPPTIPLAVRKDFGINDFFGLNQCFSDETLCDINTNAEKITFYVNGLTTVVNEMALQEAESRARISNDEKDVYVA